MNKVSIRKYLAVRYASHLAKRLHRQQKDKGGNDYFRSHLKIVAQKGNNYLEKIVGYLHDTAEDTDYTVYDIIYRLKFLNKNEKRHIKDALILLNNNTKNRKEYIDAIIDSEDDLTINTKLHDLESNMDVSRIQNISDKDYNRTINYLKEYLKIKKAIK